MNINNNYLLTYSMVYGTRKLIAVVTNVYLSIGIYPGEDQASFHNIIIIIIIIYWAFIYSPDRHLLREAVTYLRDDVSRRAFIRDREGNGRTLVYGQ